MSRKDNTGVAAMDLGLILGRDDVLRHVMRKSNIRKSSDWTVVLCYLRTIDSS